MVQFELKDSQGKAIADQRLNYLDFGEVEDSYFTG